MQAGMCIAQEKGGIVYLKLVWQLEIEEKEEIPFEEAFKPQTKIAKCIEHFVFFSFLSTFLPLSI